MLQKLMFWKQKNTAPLNQEEKEELEEQKLKEEIFDVVIFTFLSFGFLLVLYTYTWRSYTLEELAWFGDSFGVLTSFFTGLAFYGLMVTIRLQRKAFEAQKEELELTRSEMKASNLVLKEQSDTLKLQQFENTFFNLIKLLRDNANNYMFYEYEGDQAFRESLLLIHNRIELFIKKGATLPNDPNGYIFTFEPLYSDNRLQLNRFLKCLSICLIAINEQCPISKKSFYLRAITTTLSENENSIIYYYYQYAKCRGFNDIIISLYEQLELFNYQIETGLNLDAPRLQTHILTRHA